MQEMTPKTHRIHRRGWLAIVVSALIMYMAGMFVMWTCYRPPWLPGTTEQSGHQLTARAEVRGIGLLPVNGILGRYLHKVVVDYNSNGRQYVMTDFRSDGTCHFVEICPDGRVAREGRFIPLSNPIPTPQESQMSEGTTFDSQGNIIGVLEEGEGVVEYEDCFGRRSRAWFQGGKVVKSEWVIDDRNCSQPPEQ